MYDIKEELDKYDEIEKRIEQVLIDLSQRKIDRDYALILIMGIISNEYNI